MIKFTLQKHKENLINFLAKIIKILIKILIIILIINNNIIIKVRSKLKLHFYHLETNILILNQTKSFRKK